jgi:hypothetical protein
VDLTATDVGAAKAELELVQARDLLRTAFAELNHAMGIVGEPAYSLEEPTITVQSLPALESLLAESQQQRPDLLALDAQIRADEEIVERAAKGIQVGAEAVGLTRRKSILHEGEEVLSCDTVLSGCTIHRSLLCLN